MLKEDGVDSHLILNIDSDLQQVNRIHKDSTNKVRQITDKVSGIPFVQTNPAKQPTYIYGEGYRFGGNYPMEGLPINKGFEYLSISFDMKFKAIGTSYCLLLGDGATSLPIRYRYMSAGYIRFEIYLYNSAGTNIGYGLFRLDGYETIDEDYHVDITLANFNGTRKIKAFINGNELPAEGYSLTAGEHYFSTPKLFGQNGWADYGWDIIIDNLSIKEIKASDVFSDDYKPKGLPQPFSYYKRYREDGNKKLFISSRYLKDAVIDVDDNITSIKDEITNSNFVSVGTFLDNGFRSDNTLNATYLNLNPYAGIVGDKNLMFGCWFKHNDTVLYDHYYPVKNSAFNIDIIDYGTSSSRIYVMFKGESFLHNRDFGHNWGYISIAYDFSENKLYLLLNGKIIDIFTTTIGTASFNNIQFHTTSTTLTDYNGDDFLFIENVLPISIVGKSVGDEVYEPPRRRSLDSEFIQY